MKKIIIVFISCLLLGSCGKRNDVPSRYIQPKEMQSLLLDLMQTDQFLQNYVFNRDTSINKKARSMEAYDKVFRVHKVDRTLFRQSLGYYRDHPRLLQTVMDSISVMPDQAPTRLVDDSSKYFIHKHPIVDSPTKKVLN